MSILQKIKQVFGLSTAGAETESPGEGGADVTIEREPDHDDAGSEASLGAETSSGTAAEETAADAGAASGVEAEEDAESGAEPEAEDKVEASDGEPEPEPDPGADPVDAINGIGPTYSDRLGDVGIETVADLAEADPETVADAAKTGESKAMSWIDRADDHLS